MKTLAFAIVGFLTFVVWASAQTSHPIARVIPDGQSPFIPIEKWAPPTGFPPIKAGTKPEVKKETTIAQINQRIAGLKNGAGEHGSDKEIVREFEYEDSTGKTRVPFKLEDREDNFTGTAEEWINSHNILADDKIIFHQNGYQSMGCFSTELISIKGTQYVIVTKFEQDGEVNEKIYPISEPIKIEDVSDKSVRISGNGKQYTLVNHWNGRNTLYPIATPILWDNKSEDKQPEVAWEKLSVLMGANPLLDDNRIAAPHTLREYGQGGWEAVKESDLSTLPPFFKEAMAKPDPSKPYYGYDYASFRGEFSKYNVAIKHVDNTYTCGIQTTADLLEFLWSKKMGFPVKASLEKIKAVSDSIPEPVKSNDNGIDPRRLLKALAPNGGFDVLSADSKAKVHLDKLPSLKFRDLVVAIGAKSNPDQKLPPGVERPKFIYQDVAVQGLMVEEIQKGHPIIYSGLVPDPTRGFKDKIQSIGLNKAAGYSEKGIAKEQHTALITGYYYLWDWTAFGPLGCIFWELRNNWGEEYADHGYAWLSNGSENDLIFQGGEFVSVALH